MALIPLFEFQSQPKPCCYLPDEEMVLHYVIADEAAPEDYTELMKQGWRRFGKTFFYPVCPNCNECQSIRLPVDRFQPNRSQLRSLKKNSDVSLIIRTPEIREDKLALYNDFQNDRSMRLGWEYDGSITVSDYYNSFVDNPFDVECWEYYLNDTLIAVGYVDVMVDGLSAIYFYHDPKLSDRSLGTMNIINVCNSAQARGLPHVYLGYYVANCRSLKYKSSFKPNEILTPHGDWVPFQDE